MSERIWLVNPKRVSKGKGRTVAKRRRTAKRRTHKRRRSAAQIAAFKKMIAARKGAASHRKSRRAHKGAPVAKRKRSTRRATRRGGKRMRSVVRRGGAAISRKSWRASGFRRNPRRRYRRNPGFSVSGITSALKRGLVDAGLVLGGKVGTRFVANFAPAQFKDSPVKVAAVQVIAALGLGILGGKFLGGEKARFLLAGGIAGAGESFLKSQLGATNPVAALLGDDDLVLGDGEGDYAGNSLNAYESAALQVSRGMGAYEAA